MKCIKWIAWVVFVGIVGPSLGQEAPPSNYKHLKKLEPLIGTFTGTSVAVGSPVTKKGTRLNWTVTRKWILNKNVIATSTTLKLKNRTVYQERGMIGWDTAKKQIVSGSFNAAGGGSMAVWNFNDDKWSAKVQGAGGEGKKLTFTLIHCDITDSSHTVKIVDRVEAGKQWPDIQVKLKKVK